MDLASKEFKPRDSEIYDIMYEGVMRRVTTSGPEMLNVKKSQNSKSSALQKLENTGDKLKNTQESGMTPPMNPPLKTRHIKLSDKLSQSQIIHNQMSSQVYSLPNEILVEIFLYVVYTAAPTEARFPKMKDGIKRIFWRLHCLMAVCSTWRNLVINLPKLWTVVPIAGTEQDHPTTEIVSLALQRSQATSRYRVLYLVAALTEDFHPQPAPVEHTGYPQYSTINIEARSGSVLYPIGTLLQKVLKFQDPVFLSELSLHHDQYQGPHEGRRFRLPRQNEYLDYRMSDQQRDKLLEFLENVRTLRLRSINIDWNTVTFTQLVHLHVQSVVLGGHNELAQFILMFQYVPQLQTLKLISVDVLKTVTDHLYPIPENIALPELELLVLSDLSFNVLQVVLKSIAPGSHRTKVGLTGKSNIITYDKEEVVVGSNELLELLKRSNPDTLLYDVSGSESPRLDKEHLCKILKSLPTLKSLLMTGWKWDLGAICALERPRSDEPFPYLTELVIVHGGSIHEARYLPRIAAEHSLRTLVVDDASSLGDDKKIIQRLRRVVPDLRFDPHPEQVEELNHSSWRLW